MTAPDHAGRAATEMAFTEFGKLKADVRAVRLIDGDKLLVVVRGQVYDDQRMTRLVAIEMQVRDAYPEVCLHFRMFPEPWWNETMSEGELRAIFEVEP